MAYFQLILSLGLILGVALAVVIFLKAIKVVRPYEQGLVERFGKYRRTVGPGIVFLLPFIETIKKIDIRERLVDVPPQEVITKDNAEVTVDAIVYTEVFDPRKVEYNVFNFADAVTKLAQTTLRDVVGSMELDETLISRERINTALKSVLDKATDKWGINVTRVEIKRIDPPKDITEAMSKQMKAERTRRAAILEAEGFKHAAILEAEGKAESLKKVAEARRHKDMVIAEGQAKAIENVYSAIHRGMPTNDIIAIKYLETLQKMADGKATKIFLPVESSGVMGSLGGIRELFKGDEPVRRITTKKERKKTKEEKGSAA